MAPKRVVLTWLLTVALIAAAPQPSAAIRADNKVPKPTEGQDASSEKIAAAVSPKSDAVAQPSDWSLPSIPGLPPFPPLPSLPPLPPFPSLPPLPPLPPFPSLPPLPPLPPFPSLPPLPPLPPIFPPWSPTPSAPTPPPARAPPPPTPSTPEPSAPDAPAPPEDIPSPPSPTAPAPPEDIPSPPSPSVPDAPAPPEDVPSPPSPSAPEPDAPAPPEDTPTSPPSPSAPDEPTDCQAPLLELMPCMDFMTNVDAPSPPNPSPCCDAFYSLLDKAPICLCDVIETDVSEIMPAPVDRVRTLFGLPQACGVDYNTVPMVLHHCDSEPVPPLIPQPDTPAPEEDTPPSPPPPEPTECRSSLMGLMPCLDYMSHTDIPNPYNPGPCCDGVHALFREAPVCLCHALSGDINEVMPRHVDGLHTLYDLPPACGVGKDALVDVLERCSDGPAPPLMAPEPPQADPSSDP